MRGFIDDGTRDDERREGGPSQSAFMRGFIDDKRERSNSPNAESSLNPRSCAASSMTCIRSSAGSCPPGRSQSAFMRGFIDDVPA